MWVKRLVSATTEQLDKIGNIWTESLQDAWLVRSNTGFDQHIMSVSFRARAKIAADDGCLWVAGSKEGDIEGAIHALPAGWKLGESKTHPAGLPAFEELFDPNLLLWKKQTYLPWLFAAFDRAYQPHNTSVRDSFYVSILGVQASAQGKGVGAALMKASQEEANKEGVPITLMCGESSTVLWYRKLGFQEVSIDRLEVRGKTESMSLLIWKPPR